MPMIVCSGDPSGSVPGPTPPRQKARCARNSERSVTRCRVRHGHLGICRARRARSAGTAPPNASGLSLCSRRRLRASVDALRLAVYRSSTGPARRSNHGRIANFHAASTTTMTPARYSHCTITPPSCSAAHAAVSAQQPPCYRTEVRRPLMPAGSGDQRNTSANACDGVLKPRVCRGRPLSRSAMASKSV